MKRHLGQAIAVAALVTGGFVVTQGVASAAFLCPSVGNETAATHNDVFGGDLGPNDPDSYTFIPGNNQAGPNANPNSNNTLGPGVSPGPGGGNFDWSPIWPGDPA